MYKAEKVEDYMLPCLNKKIFGFDCPGCGSQRALNFILHGEFAAAFKIFPAIYTTILLFAFIGLHFVDRSHKYHKAIIGTAIANTVIMVVSYGFKIANIN